MARCSHQEHQYVALSLRADVVQRLLREGLLCADMLHCRDADSKRQLSHWLLRAAADPIRR